MHPQHILTTLALALPAFFASTSAAYIRLGCYSEVPDLKGDSTNAYQAYGQCIEQCLKGGYRIAALSKGDHCSCSNAVPPDSAKVSDDKCNTMCPGYPRDYCGGDDGTYMVISTGESAVISESDGGAAATPTAATAAGGIVVAATNVSPSTVPTSILTAPSSMTTKAGASGAASNSATVTAASSSASASPTNNAAVSLRGGSSVAVLFAGLGLLL